MSQIKLLHSGGNGAILSSPASNPSSDITLKLPSNTGSAGQVLKVASANHSSTNAELEFAADRTNRNLIINGACLVAQRGTSATGSAANGYATVDRFRADQNGTDAYIEQHQVDVASGTTPYAAGFRKAFQVKNGNQASGAGTNDRVIILHRIEGQDLANSGWNYTSASSYVSFSFWVKSSVAQNFFFTFKSGDGTPQKYAMETGSLTADTWTKITKTIPGASNVQFDNDNGEGLEIEWSIFRGTDMTGSMSLNAWAANNNSVRTPDQTSTWYTTNDATFELTGVQLEVGSVATDFEHRSYGQELALCGRYYQKLIEGNTKALGIGFAYNGSTVQMVLQYPLGKMRTTPSIDAVTGADYWRVEGGGITVNVDGSWVAEHARDTQMAFYGVPDATLSTLGLAHYVRSNNSAAKFAFSAEL